MSNKNSSEMDAVAGDLYGEIWISEYSAEKKVKHPLKDYLPGLILVAVAGVTATWLAEHYRMPVVLGGLLIGLALNFVSTSPKVHLGLDVCSSSLLRWGVVLLGTQITAAQISSLGFSSFMVLIVIMAMVIVTGIIGAKLSGQNAYVGLLVGGATAICGASAALALYALIGRERLTQAQFTLSLVGIALASAIAMSFYPLLASASGFTDQQAGFLMGAAIHDVAQSLGGGYSFSERAGEYATIVKLSRVALLAPVIALIGLAIPGEGSKRQSFLTRLKLPWFVLAFFAIMIVNSLIALPAWVQEYGSIASKTMLLCAVAATAMRSRLDALVSQGWRPLIPVVLATSTAFVCAFGFAWNFL